MLHRPKPDSLMLAAAVVVPLLLIVAIAVLALL